VLETQRCEASGGRAWPRPPNSPAVSKAPRMCGSRVATPQLGVIGGLNRPPNERSHRICRSGSIRRRPLHHREFAASTLELETSDGGNTWKSASASIFGQVTRIRFGPPSVGLGLIEFSEEFQYSSEVYSASDGPAAGSERVYRDRKVRRQRCLGDSGRHGLISRAFVATAQLRSVVPGRVRVLKSRDFSTWTDIEVTTVRWPTAPRSRRPATTTSWLATDTA